MKPWAKQTGFTIVELLIVIVVIGILAGITIVAYSGIQKRAQLASAVSYVANAKKKIDIFKIDTDSYPGSITDCPTPAAANLCIPAPAGTTILYNQKNNAVPASYEVAALAPAQFYYESDAEITSAYANEFVQYTDLAPIIDKYGLVPYKIDFDIKTASTSSGNEIMLYLQNGSGSRYGLYASFLPTTTYAHKTFTLTPTPGDNSMTQAILAFYGVYGTGNRATVKNLRLQLQ